MKRILSTILLVSMILLVLFCLVSCEELLGFDSSYFEDFDEDDENITKKKTTMEIVTETESETETETEKGTTTEYKTTEFIEEEIGTEENTEISTDNNYFPNLNLSFTNVEPTVIYSTTHINLRKEPSFENSVEKQTVVAGTALVKIAESNETAKDSDGYDYKWFKVKYEDSEWYVKSTLTTTLANPDEGFVPVEKTLYLNTNGLSARQFPNSENPPVAYLSYGEEITVIAENKELGWYKISYNGKYSKGEFYIISDSKYYSDTPIV